jgi:hypothetical protein
LPQVDRFAVVLAAVVTVDLVGAVVAGAELVARDAFDDPDDPQAAALAAIVSATTTTRHDRSTRRRLRRVQADAAS